MKKLLAVCTTALQALGLARGGIATARHAHKRVRITKPLAAFTTAALAIGLAVVGVAAPAAANDNVKVQLCHATGSESNPYTAPDVSVNAFFSKDDGNGHDTHLNDIVKPFNYVADGQTINFPGRNWDAAGQTIFNNDCKSPESVVPTAPTPTYSSCVYGTFTPGSYTITKTKGVDYFVNSSTSKVIFGSGSSKTVPISSGTVSITAKSTDSSKYTLTSTGPWTFNFDSDPCVKSYVIAAWTMPSWVGPQTPTWPQTLFSSKKILTTDLAALDSVLGQQCGTQYQVDLYKDSATTTSLINGGFLTDSGVPPEDPIPGGWDAAYKLFHTPDCVVPAVPAATVVAVCGTGGGVTFTVTLSNKYTAAENTKGTDFAATIYVDERTPVTVTVPATTGTDTTVKQYSFTEDSGSHTVVVKNGDTVLGSLTKSSDCALNSVMIDTDPSASSCMNTGDTSFASWIYVDLNSQVVYKIDGTVVDSFYTEVNPGVAHNVTAEAATGFVLVGTHAHTWTLTAVDTANDCLATEGTATPAVTQSAATCVASGSYTLSVEEPELIGDILWTVDGKPAVVGTYTAAAGTTVHVVATAVEGSGISGSETGSQEWTITIASPDASCAQLKTLAFTGADGSIGGMLTVALFLLLGGAGVYTAGRFRSRES